MTTMNYPPSYYIKLMQMKVIPSYPCDTSNAPTAKAVHNECIKMGCWPMLSLTWLRDLAKLCKKKRVLEVYAGGGWLAKYLHSKGIEVLAIDNFQFLAEGLHTKEPVYHVQQMYAELAVETLQHRYDVLLMSWPPIDATKLQWEKEVIFIGNESCANTEFLSNYIWNLEIPLPSWPDYEDWLRIGKLR